MQVLGTHSGQLLETISHCGTKIIDIIVQSQSPLAKAAASCPASSRKLVGAVQAATISLSSLRNFVSAVEQGSPRLPDHAHV